MTTPLTRLGGPAAGTLAALAIGPGQPPDLFAGSRAGLYRLSGQAWTRLAEAPVGILALAASPDFGVDQTLVAGTAAGIFLSNDAGRAWRAAHLPLKDSAVVALSFSPNFAADGIVLAGSLEDGILYSDDRGLSWSNRSFGILDAAILAVAFSPGFAQDEIAFAASETTLYQSYNGARAWKQLNFPDTAAPVLSLAVSPRFGDDGRAFAGTEQDGLYATSDGGESWQKLDVPAVCINALDIAPDASLVIAATEAGILASADAGVTWQAVLDRANVFSLAAAGGHWLAAVADAGAWHSADVRTWEPLPELAARSLLGLALSPRFSHDGVAFIYGPQEGLWVTADGGQTWTGLNDDWPSQDILDLAISPAFPKDQTLAAAGEAGLWVSLDAGQTWQCRAAEPAARASFSPDRRLLAASFGGGGVRWSEDLGQTWSVLPGPWQGGGKVLALAVGPGGHYHLAWLEGVGETVSVWQGKPPELEKVLSVPAGHNAVVSFHVPGDPAPDRPWYAGLGNQVWTLSAGRGRTPVAATAFAADERPENLLALGGVPADAGHALYACTGQYLYRSTDGENWSALLDFSPERAVALALSPDFDNDRTAYIMLLGGSFCKVTIY